MAEDDARRAAANKEPLMSLAIPDDCFSRPRMYGYKIDETYWLRYAEGYRSGLGKDPAETAELGGSQLISITLARLRRLSGIKYISLEWCLPEDYSRAEARKNRLQRLRMPPADDAVDGHAADASASAPSTSRSQSPCS